MNKHLKEQSDNLTIKSKLLETKDSIYNMMEDNDSFSEKVLKLYELKKKPARLKKVCYVRDINTSFNADNRCWWYIIKPFG